MPSHSQGEIDTHVLASELRELNLKRTPGEWRLYADKYIVEPDRLAPHLAQTGGIRAKANAAYLFYLASHSEVILARLERLVRLEKLISELPSGEPSAKQYSARSKSQYGEAASSAEATSTPTGTPSVVGLA